MVGKILLIILALFVILWLARGLLITRRRGEVRQAESPLPGELVTCAHCGVHLPRAEARSAGGLHYCSEEHWRLGPKADK